MINFNFHQHSNFSDGAYPPEDYVKKAIDLGFEAIVNLIFIFKLK